MQFIKKEQIKAFIKIILSITLLFSCKYPWKKVLAETPWQPTNLTKEHISSIETTPYGIFAGEFSTKYWELPFNGIYFSSDKGMNWVKSGLKYRGVTDIAHTKDIVFATTYYSTTQYPAGLYKSTNWGKDWSHVGPDTPASKVEVLGDTVLLGTYNQGLWISNDLGKSWKRILEGEERMQYIDKIFMDEAIIFVRGHNEYRNFLSSKDNGITWEREEWLEILDAFDFWVYDNLLYIATDYLNIVVSKDFKTIYRLVGNFDSNPVHSLYRIGVNFYAGVLNEASNVLDIYKSTDQGINWESTNLTEAVNTDSLEDIQSITGVPSYIFGLFPGKGVYRKEISFKRDKEPFLGNLWKNQKPNDILNKITSFFDHEYPLLGYGFYSEPSEYTSSTVNFLGQKGKEPEIYYSSHNGYDFALPYGTELTAPYDGIAKGVYCPACGNTILIKHPNGYMTVYMHLQKENLIAQMWEDNIPVNEGDVIGKVGMTGNTTGPHLHFEVRKPDYTIPGWGTGHPSGLTDPFGWQNDFKYDPWAFFKWEDGLGRHTGKASKYLWKEETNLSGIKKAFNGNPLLMDLDNINIQIPSTIYPLPLAFQIAYLTPPTPPESTQKYVEGTALSIV
ncbi:MAG TPA: hypothetical protein ENN92_00985, partial [candidate division WWE3 bacterium]|nr:hypothetical protein [candidate division WWE3 bacterium]